MKLYCNGLDLADSFSKVTKAITGKSTAQILEGVKISALGDKLTLLASDTEITIENTINANIMLEGDIVVPGKLMAELVRKMGSQQVELECIDDKILNIKYMDSSSKIMLYNYDEYPKFIDNDYDTVVTMTQKQFRDVISKAVFAAATDDFRPILKGCLLTIDGDNISLIAIDGQRLAITKQHLVQNSGRKSVVAPAKALNEIAKLTTDSDDLMTIYISDKKIMADMGHTKVIASLMEGDFVNIDRVIPKEFFTELTIVREQLEQALDRVSIISRNVQANLIKIEITDGVMTLLANAEIGNICEKVPVSMKGKDVKIAINSKFLTDCLKAIDDEYIKLNLSESTKPCTITPIEGDDYLYLILPVRIMA